MIETRSRRIVFVKCYYEKNYILEKYNFHILIQEVVVLYSFDFQTFDFRNTYV